MALDQYVAKRIQTLRKEFNLTQEQLAETAGMDVSSIAKIERGERSNIKVNTLEKIVEAFGLTMSSFFQSNQEHTTISDPLFEKFHNRLQMMPQEKQKQYLRLFEEIVKIEN
ncbi:helix-turn-helix transcriptional regulator [Streptococcus pneumoniae]